MILAQGPGSLFVDAGPDVTVNCCTDLTAQYLTTRETISASYTVTSIPYAPPFAFNGLANQLNPNQDDSWSAVDSLPYDFCFFGELVEEFQVGSNGVLRFDVAAGDTTNEWAFNSDIPNNTVEALAEANVFTPVHDIDPSVSGSEEIGYEVLGTAPDRVLVVSFYEVPLFQCNSLLATHMVVFYEFSNIIEFYIQDKPTCTGWNSGNAALGIQNNDGTVGYTPPGRNTSDSPWTTTNEAWRFSPDGVETSVFEWLDADGNVISTSPTITVCPDGTETYTARVTYTNTCNGDVVVLTDDVEVTADSPFVVDIGPDVVRCDTSAVTLDAEVGDPGVSYQWFRDDVLISGATNPEYSVNYPDSGTYRCDVTSAICTLSDETQVNFYETPIANPANDLSQCDDDASVGEFDLRVNRPLVLGGQDPLEYSVSFHNSLEDAENDAAAITNEAAYPITGDTETIFVRIENASEDCYDTTSFVISYLPPDFAIEIGEDINSCDTETITLDVGLSGAEFTYQWFLDGVLISGANDPTFVVSWPNSGTYSCEVSDSVCTLIDAVEVNYREQPIIAEDPISLFQCDDGVNTGEFNLAQNRPIVLGSQDPFEFSVTFHTSLEDAQTQTDPIPNETNYLITGSEEIIYIRIEDSSGFCYATSSFPIIFSEVRVGEVTDLAICDFTPFGIEEVNLPEIKDAEALDGQDPALFEVSYHRSQLEANGGTNPISTPYEVVVESQTIYVRVQQVVETDCYVTDSFELQMYEAPMIRSVADFEICDDLNDGFEEFDLSAKISEIIGDQDLVQVRFFDSETAALEGDPDTQLPLAYTNTTPNEQVIWVRLERLITDTDLLDGCFDIAPLTLRLLPVPIVTLEDTYRLCVNSAGEPIASEMGASSPPLLDTGLNILEYSFEWTLDGAVMADEEDPTQPETDAIVVARVGGTYQVLVTNLVTGCITVSETVVSVSAPPATYSAEVVGEVFSGNYNIEVSVTGEGDYEFQIGDIRFQDSNVFEGVYPGEHIITIRDKNGCGSVSIPVTVIHFPKFFTPNGDGHNDYWNISDIEMLDPNATVAIFDRYGKLLKQMTVQATGWDGTFNGSPLPSNDYWFVITYEIDGVQREYRDHFSLKR
ncbi:T9SS type B sorting domain-containing protein [Altibacter sp. HG106]|uniref:T9SS type B sorting domain-containing protein n=1 Tax=Altibacter sp. HG106 TaxID=3023937 RepID=UPI002350C884|nr:T9SS type B sorting domain-containing protein [Altibacter sp. HG106]MDC7994631.1 T9SS type B sorting domain-containing protein [Altibacter sp. HG106]